MSSLMQPISWIFINFSLNFQEFFDNVENQQHKFGKIQKTLKEIEAIGYEGMVQLMRTKSSPIRRKHCFAVLS